MVVSKSFFPIFFFFFALCPGVYGVEPIVFEDLELACDAGIIYEEDNQTLTARTNASLSGKGFILLAQQISWNRKTSEVFASGSVVMTRLESRLLAESMLINLANGNIQARQLRGVHNRQFFESDLLDKNQSSWTLTGAKFYLGEPDWLSPNLVSESFSLDENTSRIDFSSPAILVGTLPLLPLPDLSFSRSRSSLPRTKFNLRGGNDSVLGWYGLAGLKHQGDDLSRAISLTFYEQRGLLLSPELNWESTAEEHPVELSLLGGWIDDQGEGLGQDANLQAIDRNRAYAQLSLTARPHSNWHISAVTDWEDDSEFLRDFKREEYYQSQWNQNHAEITYEGRAYSISVSTQWQMNQHEAMVESIPFVDIESGPVDLAGLYHTSSLNYAHLVNRDRWGERNASLGRTNLGYKVEKPIQINKGIILNPSWAFRQQIYDFSQSSSHRAYAEYGVDLQTTLHRHYSLQSNIWEVEKALHLSRFSFAYRQTDLLTGEQNLALPFSPPRQIDLNLAPLDLLDHQEHDHLTERKLARLGWENLLFAKWNGASREIIHSRIFYDLWHADQSMPEDPHFLYTHTSIRPSDSIALTHSAKLETSSGVTYRNSFGLHLQDGRFQGIELAYVDYLENGAHAQVSYWTRWSEKLLLNAQANYSLESQSLTSWLARIDYQMTPAWMVNFSVIERMSSQRGNFTEANLGISLASF
jgi:hypothetical protein